MGRREHDALGNNIQPAPDAKEFNKKHGVSADPDEVKQTSPKKYLHSVRRKKVDHAVRQDLDSQV